MIALNVTTVRLLLLLFATASNSQTGTQTHARTKPEAATGTPTINTFFVESVEPEPEGSSSWYRVEGLTGTTNDDWRYVLSCSPYPPPGEHRQSGEESAQRLIHYRDLEWFREMALHAVGSYSLDHLGITLYGETEDVHCSLNPNARFCSPANVDRGEKIRESTEGEQNLAVFQQRFAECRTVNRIRDVADVFSVKVVSSEFRKWRDGAGYQIVAQTEKESLILGCTEQQRAVCMSLQPNEYRATRSESRVRLYDANLHTVGIFRILGEYTIE